MQHLVELKLAYCNNQMQKVKEIEVIMMRMVDNSQFAAQILDVLNSTLGENEMGQLMFIVSLISLLMKRIYKYNDVNLTHFYQKLCQTQVNNVILKKSAQLMAVYLEKNVGDLPQLIRPPFNPLILLILSELVVLEDIATFLSDWLFVQNRINDVFQAYLQDPSNPLLLEIMENSLALYKDNLDFISFLISSLISALQQPQTPPIVANHIFLFNTIASISIRPNILVPILLNPQIHDILQQYCYLESTGAFYMQFLELFKKSNSNTNPDLLVVQAFFKVALQFSQQAWPICLYSLYLFDYCCRYKVDIAPILNACLSFKPLIQQQVDEDVVYIQQSMSKVQSILATIGRDHFPTACDILLSKNRDILTILPGIIRNVVIDTINSKKMHLLLLYLLQQWHSDDQFTRCLQLLIKKLPSASLALLEHCLNNSHHKNASTICQTICMHHSRVLIDNYQQIAPSVIYGNVPIAMKFSICCIPLLSSGLDADLFTLLQSVPVPQFQPQMASINDSTSFDQIYPQSQSLIDFLLLSEQFFRLRNVLLDPLKSSIIEIPNNIKSLYNSFLEYVLQGLKQLQILIKNNKQIGPSRLDIAQILRQPNGTSESPTSGLLIQINMLVAQCYDILGLALAWPLFYENENAISILTSYIFTEDVVDLHMKYWGLIINNMVLPCISNSKASQHKTLLGYILKPFLVYMVPLIKSKIAFEDSDFESGDPNEGIVFHHYLQKLIKSFLSVVEQSMTMMSSESFGEERLVLLSNSFGLIGLGNENMLQRYLVIIKENISVLFNDVQVNLRLLQEIINGIFYNLRENSENKAILISVLGILIKYHVDIQDVNVIVKCIQNVNGPLMMQQMIMELKDLQNVSEKAIRKQLAKIL